MEIKADFKSLSEVLGTLIGMEVVLCGFLGKAI